MVVSPTQSAAAATAKVTAAATEAGRRRQLNETVNSGFTEKNLTLTLGFKYHIKIEK